MHGMHVVKTWSVTQATVALSSAEAEYSALVKAASIALGFKSLCQDLCIPQDVPIELRCDSSAAIGIASRTGLGKVRHLAVHLLWLQEQVRSRHFKVTKVGGAHNLADLLTKHLSNDSMSKHLHNMRIVPTSGRSATAPQALL